MRVLPVSVLFSFGFSIFLPSPKKMLVGRLAMYGTCTHVHVCVCLNGLASHFGCIPALFFQGYAPYPQ